MKHLTWPAALAFVIVPVVLAVMFGLADDVSMQQQVLGYFDSIVPYITAGAGAVAGGLAGFTGGYNKGYATAKMELLDRQRGFDENGRLQADSMRRTAEVVRVVAEEGHQAADEAKAALDALREVTKESRGVAEAHRAFLAEAQHTMAAYHRAVPGSAAVATKPGSPDSARQP